MASGPTITLAYHRISQRVISAGTWVRPGQLAAHLDAVHRAGFDFISPSEFLVRRTQRADPAAAPQILLTFDDATSDIHFYAHILKDRGLRPVVFVPVDFLGRANTWEWNLPGRRTRHCSVAQIRKLADLGWEIGLHGSSHQDLTRLSSQELDREVSGGCKKLGEITGRPVRFFSYPFGLADDRVADAVRRADIAAAFLLTGLVPQQDMMLLPRRPVYCVDTARDILAKVNDPAGETFSGRWQLWKERVAHGVGRAAVRVACSAGSA